MHLFSNRSQRTSKCGKNISDTLGCASCATFLFLPHFDVICDLLLNRRTATWNLFVKYLSYEFFSYDRHDRYNYMETRLKARTRAGVRKKVMFFDINEGAFNFIYRMNILLPFLQNYVQVWVKYSLTADKRAKISY